MLEYDRNSRTIRRYVAAKTLRCDGDRGGKRGDGGASTGPWRDALAAAENQARNDKNLLRRALTTNPAVPGVFARLETCGPDQRCHSAACAMCITAASLTMVPLISGLIGSHPGPWSYVTIIQTRRTIRQGELAQHSLFESFEAKLHEFFDESDAVAIGTLEISCNEHHAGVHGPRYVEHAHIFTPQHITPALRRRLLGLFPRTAGVKRPLKVRPYDRNDDAVDYGLKTHVVRRIQLPRTRPDGSRTIFSTRKRRLRGPQRVEVAIAMSRRAPVDQLFVHGIQVVETHGRACLEIDDRLHRSPDQSPDMTTVSAERFEHPA